MPQFEIVETPLAGLKIVQRLFSSDTRGYFSRFFCADELELVGFDTPIAQINHTYTAQRGTVRGLHFQFPPHAEVKLVSCMRGEVFDVAVDLRRESPTFSRWHGEVLSAENRKSLLIPRGFAHGFQTLGDDCELIYLHTCAYSAAAEGAVNVLDPLVGIGWPLAITALSDRDGSHPLLNSEFIGIRI